LAGNLAPNAGARTVGGAGAGHQQENHRRANRSALWGQVFWGTVRVFSGRLRVVRIRGIRLFLRNELRQHAIDRPDFNPSFGNVALAAVAGCRESEVVVREPDPCAVNEALQPSLVAGRSSADLRKQALNLNGHTLSLAEPQGVRGFRAPPGAQREPGWRPQRPEGTVRGGAAREHDALAELEVAWTRMRPSCSLPVRTGWVSWPVLTWCRCAVGLLGVVSYSPRQRQR